MQIVESHHPALSKHILTDEIYAPRLNAGNSAAETLANKAALKAQQHMQAIRELHRFLESSCDCV